MDTTRGDRMGFNGYGRPTTPRLDEMARQSVVFRNAWSSSPWTGPAHASLFTGLRPEHHGFFYSGRLFLDEAPATLAGLLRDAGYMTACFSVNTWVAPEFGLTRGFEFSEAIGTWVKDFTATWQWSHSRALGFARRAVQDGRPFFLFVNDMEPHLPYQPAEEFREKLVLGATPPDLLDRAVRFGQEDAEIHNLGVEPASPELIRVLSDLYDAEVATLDAALGRLMDGLADSGALENTVLVIMSDHGENLGEFGLLDHRFSLNRTLLHIPLLIHYPGTFDGGRKVDDLVRIEDVFPTVLDLCGLEPPREIDGVTLTRDLPGRKARAILGLSTPPLLTRVSVGPALRRFTSSRASVNDGRFQLILSSSGDVELFDLETDPTGMKNVAADRPETVERLRLDLPRFK